MLNTVKIYMLILGKVLQRVCCILPIFEVCDSKSKKSAPMYCLEGTPLRYGAFAWIVGLTNLAQ